MSGVVLLDVSENAHIIVRYEVNRHSLSAKSSRTPDAMDVEFALERQVVVDHKRDLLDIETSTPHISGNEDTRVAQSELLHDGVSFFLHHASMHRTDREVALYHFLSEPLHSLSLVAEYHSLRYGKCVVEITESFKLVAFFFYCYEELLDLVKCQLITTH